MNGPFWRGVVVVVLLAANTGCTLVGAGIGAAVPSWEAFPPPTRVEHEGRVPTALRDVPGQPVPPAHHAVAVQPGEEIDLRELHGYPCSP